MTESLYLVIERHRKRWNGPRIAKVSKRKPTLARPSEQALVRLCVQIPDNVLEPRVVHVEVKPEHIVAPVVTAQSSPV
jgi:hypothetical protein